MRPILLCAGLLLAFAPPATADLTLEYMGAGGRPASALYIKGDWLRMDAFEGEPTTTLFNASRKEIIVIETRQRRYTVMDQAAISEMKRHMEQAMQMIEQMGMSKDQIAQMMPGIGGKMEITHRRTGSSGEVEGRACEVVETSINGELEMSACVAAPGSLGIDAVEIATLKGMSDMLTEMAMDILPSGMVSIDVQGMDGVPLETRDAAGQLREKLARFSDAAVDAAKFEIPNGFRQQSIDLGR